MLHFVPPQALIHRRDAQEDHYSYEAKDEGHDRCDFWVGHLAGLVLQVAAMHDASKSDEMRANTAECCHPEVVVAPEVSDRIGNNVKNKYLDS